METKHVLTFWGGVKDSGLCGVYYNFDPVLLMRLSVSYLHTNILGYLPLIQPYVCIHRYAERKNTKGKGGRHVQHNLSLETEILTEDVRIIKKFNLGYLYQEDNCKIVKDNVGLSGL